MIASLCACSKAEQYFVLGTFLEVKASGNGSFDAQDNVYEFMSEIEDMLSPTLDTSDIYKVNNARVGEEIECSVHTIEVAKIAKRVYELSNGAYDPSIYPIVRFYKMSGDLYISSQLSTDFDLTQIPTLMSVVGLDRAFKFDFEKGTITKLIDGAMLDFGGVAKGYAVDRARELFDGEMLINLGGNISAKGKNYTIGIANPTRVGRETSQSSYYSRVTLSDGECISTSGDYQRYYVVNVDGEQKIYHHIIDARTGLCADKGIASCTVITDDGALGDALATAVVALGYEEGKRLLESVGAKAIIIFDDLTCACINNPPILLD